MFSGMSRGLELFSTEVSIVLLKVIAHVQLKNCNFFSDFKFNSGLWDNLLEKFLFGLQTLIT
jgi:hypothetical protein